MPRCAPSSAGARLARSDARGLRDSGLVAHAGGDSREARARPRLVLLRRIPVERYSEDELRILYWGLGLHLGTPRYQNGNGELIGDVRDENRLYGGVREVNRCRPASRGRHATRRARPGRCASTPIAWTW
jgi:hypothetical protein